MNRPMIGISGSHNVADRQLFVRENYMQSVLRAGGIPVLLPEIEDEETAAQILAHLDGLLLAGGGDILTGPGQLRHGIAASDADHGRSAPLVCRRITAVSYTAAVARGRLCHRIHGRLWVVPLITGCPVLPLSYHGGGKNTSARRRRDAQQVLCRGDGRCL